MQKERKLQAIRVTLGHETNRKGQEVIFFCPNKHTIRPGRTEGHLSVNIELDIFNCWACGFRGPNLTALFKKNSPARAEYVKDLEDKVTVKKPEKIYDECRLPSEFRSLTREWSGLHYEAAMRYLFDRNLSAEDIIKWKLGYCESGEYRNRIIIPSFDEFGHLNFLVGRSFYETPFRYHIGNLCKDVIWNDYMIDWNKPITIVEGPFDALKASDNVIALGGTFLHDKLLAKIVTTGVDVFFALDQDAHKTQVKMVERLISYGTCCHIVPLNGRKDVGEMTKEEFIENKKMSVTIRNEIDILKMRIES